jgi:hypothetical protein
MAARYCTVFRVLQAFQVRAFPLRPECISVRRMNFDNFPSIVVHPCSSLPQFPVGYMPTAYERGMLAGGFGVCLPVSVPSGGEASYARKDFGRGKSLSMGDGALIAVNALYLTPEVKHVHFALSLGLEPRVLSKEEVETGADDYRLDHPGRITFSCRPQPDTGLFAPSRMLTAPLNPQEFATKDNWSGYAGTIELSTGRAGWYEFGIHGSAQGVLLHWIAMTAT